MPFIWLGPVRVLATLGRTAFLLPTSFLEFRQILVDCPPDAFTHGHADLFLNRFQVRDLPCLKEQRGFGFLGSLDFLVHLPAEYHR